MLNPIAFSASNIMDNLYEHQAMKATDTRGFQKAVNKEVNNYIEQKHWKLILI